MVRLSLVRSSAIFVEEDRCVGAFDSQATLTGTDVINDPIPDLPETNLPALFHLMVVGFGMAGGVFLSRRLGSARSGLRV